MNEKIEELKKLVRRLANDAYQNGLVDEQDTSYKQQRKYADLAKQHQDDLMAGLDELVTLPPVPAKPDTLQSDAGNLLLALGDAWPYVHQWCTIETVKNRIGQLLRKHGDFADLNVAKPLQPDLQAQVQQLRESLSEFVQKSHNLPIGPERDAMYMRARAALKP